MTKVIVLSSFVIGEKSFSPPHETLIDIMTAYSLALKGVVEFKNKKEFTTLDENIKADEKAKLEKQEENEKQVAAILEKDFLEKKRVSLQQEVDAITDILGDAAIYYKSYIDLSDDLGKLDDKQESTEEK